MPAWLVTDELLELTKQSVHAIGEAPLIIVDNASPLGGGYLRSIATTYIRNQKNLGYAPAVNQGIDLARTRFVAVIENDVRVSPNWQEVTQRIFSSNPETGTLHFRMTDYDVPFAYGNKVVTTGMERWCTAGCFVLDRETGLRFDEGFFNSYEDWDIFFRVRELMGRTTTYTDQACYQHLHSHSQKQIPEREENNRRNAEHFRKKWGKYAEELFAEKYPDQMARDYFSGFNL